jgi:hypothetical protein
LGFAVAAEAVGFAGEVFPVEVAVGAGEDGAYDAVVDEGEGDAAAGGEGFDLVPTDDADAAGVGGPCKDAALFVERGDLPDGGHELWLPDAGAAAEGERADIHALDPGDGWGPRGPALDIEQDFPDAGGRNTNFDDVAKVRHGEWGTNYGNVICALFFQGPNGYRQWPDR